MSNSPDWNDLLTSCFTSTEYMSLATHGDKGLWVNPVYFAWDEKFNLYFISQLGCLHMDNIQSSPEVACTIYPTNQSTLSDVLGTYVKGTARILSDSKEKKIADDIYYERKYPSDSESRKRDKDGYRINPDWHFVKVTLTALWYFDTRFFGENRIEVPESLWNFQNESV